MLCADRGFVLRAVPLLVLFLPFCGTSGCEYVGLTRPSVLSELRPPVARLVNELPDVDVPNKAMVAQLYAVGGLSHAQEGSDGVMHVDVAEPPHRFMWEPAVIDMPHGGALELRFSNHDDAFHEAYLPSDGGQQVLALPVHEGSVACESLRYRHLGRVRPEHREDDGAQGADDRR